MKTVKAIVIAMAILIAGLMAALGYGLYRKAADPDFRFFTGETPAGEAAAPAPQPGTTPPGFATRDLGLPPGTEVRTIEAADGRLYIHVRLQSGLEQVVVVDAARGTVVGTININR